jgi:Ca2+-binding RTX toxin-like protein
MRSCSLALAIVVLTPGAASGATVDFKTSGGGAEGVTGTLTFTAAPGEPNRATITQGDGKFTVTDAGAPLAPSGTCTATGDSVTCSVPEVQTLRIEGSLGDGADTATITASSMFLQVDVDGGDGNDTIGLTADSTGSASLVGGPGVDTLTGGPANDYLEGGPGADTLDGGAGQSDIVFYGHETAPVTVDLGKPGLQGVAGEQDTVRNVEGAIGGSGDDALTGDAGNNFLDGGAGSDTVSGGDGDDEMFTGDGDADVADGGAGNDKVSSGGGPARLIGGLGDDFLNGGDHGVIMLGGLGNDELSVPEGVGRASGGPGNDLMNLYADPSSTKGVSCGSGIDALAGIIGITVPRGCENVLVGTPGEQQAIPGTVRLRGGVLRVPAAYLCNGPAPPNKCKLTVTVKSRGHRVGVGKIAVPKGSSTLFVPIPVSGVKRGKPVTVVYEAPGHSGGIWSALLRVV